MKDFELNQWLPRNPTTSCAIALVTACCLYAPSANSAGVDRDLVIDVNIELNRSIYTNFPTNVSPDKWRTGVEYTTYMLFTITDLRLSRRTGGKTIIDRALGYCNDVVKWPDFDFWSTGDGFIYYADGGEGISNGAFNDLGNGFEPRAFTNNGIMYGVSRRWSVQSWWGWDWYPGVIPYFGHNDEPIGFKLRCNIPRTKIVAAGGGWFGTDDISADLTVEQRTFTGYGGTMTSLGTPIRATEHYTTAIYNMPYAAVAVVSNTGMQGVPSRISCNLIAGQTQLCSTLKFSTTGGTSEVRVRRNQSRGTLKLAGTILTAAWASIPATQTSGEGFGRESHYELPLTINMDSASRLDDAITIEMIYR
ncbi:hypothetical protein LLA64_004646 [Salmonella enterica]|nr:hypothetical protein [Salmonella enterica]